MPHRDNVINVVRYAFQRPAFLRSSARVVMSTVDHSGGVGARDHAVLAVAGIGGRATIAGTPRVAGNCS